MLRAGRSSPTATAELSGFLACHRQPGNNEVINTALCVAEKVIVRWATILPQKIFTLCVRIEPQARTFHVVAPCALVERRDKPKGTADESHMGERQARKARAGNRSYK